MKLVIFEDRHYRRFLPIAWLRPVFELRCGHGPLYEKILRNHPGLPVAFFCRDYLAETFAARAPQGATVNDPAALEDDLLVFGGSLLAGDFRLDSRGREELLLDAEGELLCARIGRRHAARLPRQDIFAFLEAARELLPARQAQGPTRLGWQWELIRHNPAAIESDFRLAGRSGVQGELHPSATIFGPAEQLYLAPGAVVHPQVVIDTHHGPVTIEAGAEVFPHSRIEGPCYLGPGTQITRGNIREGCSFGPVCRAGGEVEESIIHGYSNKYHEGFLGHAYLGEWVNLGALTTNSDLKNDYGTVEMPMPEDSGRYVPVDTADTKVGAFIGDHTKTSIGTLLNTGSHIGVMTLLMATGKPLPKFIPSFAWFLEGAITAGFGFEKLLETAEVVTARRQRPLTAADRKLLTHVHELTRPEREKAVRKDRRKLLRG